jgi:hypothetical protein
MIDEINIERVINTGKDILPNQTLYVNNLNEKIKLDGKEKFYINFKRNEAKFISFIFSIR